MRLSKATDWDQDEVLSPVCRQCQYHPQWETLFISPPETRVAELTPTVGMAGFTQPELAVSPKGELELESLAETEGFGFEAGATFPSLSASSPCAPQVGDPLVQ